MNLTTSLLTLRWMFRDTFRQAAASGLLWLLLAVDAATILFCLSISITGKEPVPLVPGDQPQYLNPRDRQIRGKTPEQLREEGFVLTEQRQITMAFGAISTPITRTVEREVVAIQLVLAGGVADTLGILLALIWTAGFLPTFLEPGVATVLLAKPIPRWALLAGKYLGVLALLLLNAFLYVGGTWIALGLRTGVWSPLYLLCIPILLLHFAIFFSFSTFLAVATRSTIACVIGSLVFWMICWGMNCGHHAYRAGEWGGPAVRITSLVGSAGPSAGLPGTLPLTALAFHGNAAAGAETPAGSASTWLLELGYWIIPKPADMSILLLQQMEAEKTGVILPADFQRLIKQGEFHPGLSILSSLLFTLVILALAGYEFVWLDY
jgi:hypothetical protein